MPFTQTEIDQAWRTTSAFHNTTPEELGIQAPLLGTVRMRCPADGSACHELDCQRNGCQGGS